MTSNCVVNDLLCIGFQRHSQTPHFECETSTCYYLYRVHKGKHQYVLVIGYEEEFCEALLEEYRVPKNTRKPKSVPKPEEWIAKGFTTERIGLGRTPVEIMNFVTT